MRQWRRATVATPGEWQCKTARSGEWAQHFSNASCSTISSKRSLNNSDKYRGRNAGNAAISQADVDIARRFSNAVVTVAMNSRVTLPHIRRLNTNHSNSILTDAIAQEHGVILSQTFQPETTFSAAHPHSHLTQSNYPTW